jgi:hypothetical protein
MGAVLKPIDFRYFPKKKPAPRAQVKRRKFGEVLKGLAPSPASCNWYAKVEAGSGWGMLGNDRYGNCAEAGMLHWTMARTAYAGSPFVANVNDALGLYSRITGFDPSRPQTDTGTNLADMMDFCERNSMLSEQDNRLLMAFPLDPTNIEEIRQAIDLCGGVLIGVNFPQAWSTSRIQGATRSPIEGGHCEYLPGYSETSRKVTLFDTITWGEHLEMTEDGFSEFCDEAWAVADLDFINATGADPQGLLQAEYERRVAELAAA